MQNKPTYKRIKQKKKEGWREEREEKWSGKGGREGEEGSQSKLDYNEARPERACHVLNKKAPHRLL